VATSPSPPAKRFGSYRDSRESPIGFIQHGACKLHIRSVVPGKVARNKKNSIKRCVK